MGRFSFKKELKFDLALLSEVESVNPFSVAKKKAKPVWEEIADILNKVEGMQVNARSCRERVEGLLKEFRADEQLSVKSSGVEEDALTEVTTLLTSISKLEEGQKFVKPAMTKLYSKKSRALAEEIRSEGLKEVDNLLLDDNEDESAPNTDDDAGPSANAQAEASAQGAGSPIEPKLDGTPVLKKRRVGGNSDLIEYLKDKNDTKFCFKREELNVRKMEADNKKLELQMEKEKQEAEIQERRRMTDLLVKLIDKST